MYALLYNDHDSISRLAGLKYKKAEHPEYERNTINRRYYSNYIAAARLPRSDP